MLAKPFESYRPSLRRWAKAFAILWLVAAGIVSFVSVRLLDQIYDDAHLTYHVEIPSLLDRNRNAIKLERLSSFLQRLSSAHDPQVERRIFLQLQTLAQGFDLDDDSRLNEGAASAVASARKIVALHASARRLAAAADPGEPGSVHAEEETAQVVDEAVQALNALTDYLSTDAALTADRMANGIQLNAAQVKQGCLAALGFFVAFGLLLLWVFQRHVLMPIAVSVRGLEAISGSEKAAVAVPRSRFFELDMIGRSIEQYARFADDLRTANSALRTLSQQDGLTGLANRRSFDTDLAETCRQACAGEGRFALLLIDIDHFKQLNDRFGHLLGDQCLRQVAMILQSFSSRRGDHAARYGGEEFAVILSDVSQEEARDIAEQLRTTVERAQIYISGARRVIGVTVSIGVAPIGAGSDDTPEQVIGAADQALYRAKHEGRNQVRVVDPDSWTTAGSQYAA